MHICFRANGLGSFTVGPCHAISFCPQIKSLVGSIIFTIACGGGFAFLTTESRPEKQWVPAGDQEKTEDDTPFVSESPALRFWIWLQSLESTCMLDTVPWSAAPTCPLAHRPVWSGAWQEGFRTSEDSWKKSGDPFA